MDYFEEKPTYLYISFYLYIHNSAISENANLRNVSREVRNREYCIDIITVLTYSSKDIISFQDFLPPHCLSYKTVSLFH